MRVGNPVTRQVIPVSITGNLFSFTSPKAGVHLFISRFPGTYFHTIEWKRNYSIIYYISNILNYEY